LAALRVLPSLPAPATYSAGGDLTLEQVLALGDRMTGMLVDTWHGVALPDRARAPVLSASIASYVVDGQPLPRQGGPYAHLHRLAGGAAPWLARHVSRRIGRPLDVALVHDGTAAAWAYAGTGRGAVIMLGTALGIGFVPPGGELRPVARDLAVEAWGAVA
jgi:hypothetical protein